MNSKQLCRYGIRLFALLLAVAGVAAAQNILVSPKLIQFPNQAINTASATYAVTLNNNQAGTLTISSIQTSAPFTESDNCGTSLAPNTSCTISVTFTPTAIKYYSSTLVLTDSAGNSPQSVSLTGNGANPVTVSPAQISFPGQGIQSTSSVYPITLTNNQSIAVNPAIQVAAPFAETDNCTPTLAAHTPCTINVTFTPTAVQYYSSAVTITGATSTAISVPVGGNGIYPVSYTPKQGGYYFDHQIVNTPSTPQAVTITNNQTTPLTFTSMSSSAAFPFTTNCGNGSGGGTLAAGASCTVQVTFDPPAATSYTANLLIYENAYGSPISIPLQGMGIAGTPGNMITVKPAAPCVLPSATEQFTADATGLSNSVYWYVDGVKGGNATVGTITASGLYNAPSTTNVHTIKAVSQSSSSVSGSALLTVSTAPNFEIYPFVSSIPTGGQQTFQGQSCNVPDTGNVSYTVDNIAGGNSTVGTVSNTGVYTAPNTPGKHTVRVTDPVLNHTSGAVVTVFSAITADFGSRANNTAVVPPNLFGYGRGESIHNATDRSLLTQAGVTVSRMSANIANVYAQQTPNWTLIDPMIAAVQQAGQHVLLQLNQSPAWLQPTSGGCAGNTFAAPTDNNQWSQMAASYVAHMDSAFPGVVTDYEIWNEPNSTGMCNAANHMNTYMALYGVAAPAMKAQAAQDGQTIRVGGPVLSGYSQIWIDTLLSTPSTAPYVDFVSYHQYFYGTTSLQVEWDQYTGDVPLYEAELDVSNGAYAIYNKMLGRVAVGQQPGGVNTPIYVTEFNTNWAFFQDCCRNDATYAPLFNALYVTDMLDSVYNASTVYNGVAHMPNQLDYFAGSAYPYFCMIGVLDANNDCLYSEGATPVPYPQYYAYQLIGGPNYLGLAAGGYMAKSISTPTGGGGLATTAFYTPTQDAIVIVNPTPASYPAINVAFANPGFSDTQGTLYTIQNGSQINATNISFAAQGTTRSTTIAVPPYSVQAISLK